MPIAPYARVTLDVCDDRGNPYEVDFEDVELINEDNNCGFDLSSFRREAAKDILVAMTRKVVNDPDQLDAFEPAFYAKVAVEWADELIKELKQN